MRPVIYDSGDPTLPDLPSDYEDLDDNAVETSSDSDSDFSVLSDSSSREEGIEIARVNTASSRCRPRSFSRGLSFRGHNNRSPQPRDPGTQNDEHTKTDSSNTAVGSLTDSSDSKTNAGILNDSTVPPRAEEVVIKEPILHTLSDTSARGETDRPDKPANVAVHEDARSGLEKPRKKKSRRSRRRYSSVAMGRCAGRKAGLEPGIDIRNTDVILNSLGSVITIVDYNAARYRVATMELPSHCYSENTDNDSLENQEMSPEYAEFLDLLQKKPSWSKVRWINVNGLSWQAISAIASHHQLHRLSIEDMVDIPQRTKTDEYPNHLFCCLPVHKLVPSEPQQQQLQRPARSWFRKILGTGETSLARSRFNRRDTNVSTLSGLSSVNGAGSGVNRAPGFLSVEKNKLAPAMSRKLIRSSVDEYGAPTVASMLAKLPKSTIYDWQNPSRRRRKSQLLGSNRPLAPLQKAVSVEQVSLFLTNQGTVISFFEHSAGDVEKPILARLSTDSTILRESSDPSMLLQAIVDAIVDLINPIILTYRERLEDLQAEALTRPSMVHTQQLHLISAEMRMLRNALIPITAMLVSLRDHGIRKDPGFAGINLPQAVAHFGHSHLTRRTGPLAMSSAPTQYNSVDGPTQFNGSGHDEEAPSQDLDAAAHSAHRNNQQSEPVKGTGAISELASMYLADVADHSMAYTEDLNILTNNTKSMIDLIFNTISIESSESVKFISLVTVIFMPLTFVSGYFGMNFHTFDALDNSDLYFWYIAIPVTAFLMTFLRLSWIREKLNDFCHNTKSEIRHFKRRQKRKELKKRLRKEREVIV